MREVDEHHRAERLNHALYGLIIITATLVAESDHVAEPVEALVLLVSTALVLLLAHTYSAYMAERAVKGAPLTRSDAHLVAADNVPVLLAIVLPSLLFVGSAFGWIALSAAYTLSISSAIAALLGLGIYEAYVAGMKGLPRLMSGVAAASVGFLIVLVEAFFD